MPEEIPLWWNLCGIATVVLLLLVNMKARSAGILAIFLVNLPGVMLHELAHYSVGVMLGASPAGFSLIPRKNAQGSWTLGCVSFRRVNAFNAVPIGLAPLGTVGLAWLMFEYWQVLFPFELVSLIFTYAVCFYLLFNSLPSLQDLKVAFNWKSLVLYGAVGTAVAVIYPYV